MSNTQTEPTFNGFKPSDFGYVKPKPIMTKKERRAADASMRREAKELFGENGYVERSMLFDQVEQRQYDHDGTASFHSRHPVLVAARRNLRGVALPSKKEIIDRWRGK